MIRGLIALPTCRLLLRRKGFAGYLSARLRSVAGQSATIFDRQIDDQI